MFRVIYMLFLFLNFITFSLNVNNIDNNILPNVNSKYYTKLSFPFIGNQEIEYLQYKKFKSKITCGNIGKIHHNLPYLGSIIFSISLFINILLT